MTSYGCARAFAFIVPRYFSGIGGGAEHLIGSLAHKLAEQGDRVEIWTTCARDNRTWENYFVTGAEQVGKLTVRRFAVDARDIDSWVPLQIAISQGAKLTLEDELSWMSSSVNSTDLYAHIARSGQLQDALFFGPYLFGTTFWGSLIHPEKSVLIPCLHDESYAYTQPVASMFRQVRGALFNSLPEQELANNLYGQVLGGCVGMGFDNFSQQYVRSLTPYFQSKNPYLFYLGRKETGKGVQRLIDQFVALKENGGICEQLRLVVAGPGSFADLERDNFRTRDDIVDLQFVSEEEKHRLLKYCLALCQPSRNESFSIVIMESWLLETPCIVDSRCDVTMYHVKQASGGLFISNEDDLAGACSLLIDSPEVRRRLAVAGKKYVEKNYSWPAVLERFDGVLAQIGSSKNWTADG